jgi:hypothetical protein
MSKRLKTFVHVPDEQGGYAVFGPDDKVPAWAAKQMGDHVWETESDDDGEDVTVADGEVAATPTPARNSAAK